MQKDCRNNPCQRFGSALNLNVHCHLLVPDGAYTFEHDKPHLHRVPAPSPTELRQLLDTLIARITRTLVRGGELIEEPEHPYLDLELNSPLEQLSAAAVRYRIAVGPLAGRKTMTLRNPGAMVDDTTSSKPFTAARDGFSINAAVGCVDIILDEYIHVFVEAEFLQPFGDVVEHSCA